MAPRALCARTSAWAGLLHQDFTVVVQTETSHAGPDSRACVHGWTGRRLGPDGACSCCRAMMSCTGHTWRVGMDVHVLQCSTSSCTWRTRWHGVRRSSPLRAMALALLTLTMIASSCGGGDQVRANKTGAAALRIISHGSGGRFTCAFSGLHVRHSAVDLPCCPCRCQVADHGRVGAKGGAEYAQTRSSATNNRVLRIGWSL